MKVFEQHESNVRSYCRSFPVVFDRAANALAVRKIWTEAGVVQDAAFKERRKAALADLARIGHVAKVRMSP